MPLTESQWVSVHRPSGPIGFRLSLTPRAPIRGSGSDDRVGSLLVLFVAEWHAVLSTSWRRDQGPLINAEIRREEVHFVELG